MAPPIVTLEALASFEAQLAQLKQSCRWVAKLVKRFPPVRMVTVTRIVLAMTFESHKTMRWKHGLTAPTDSHVKAHSNGTVDGYKTVEGGALGHSQWLRCPCTAKIVCSGCLSYSTVSSPKCQSTAQ